VSLWRKWHLRVPVQFAAVVDTLQLHASPCFGNSALGWPTPIRTVRSGAMGVYILGRVGLRRLERACGVAQMVGSFLSMTYKTPQWDEHVIPQLRFLEFVDNWDEVPEFEIRDVSEVNALLSEYSEQRVQGRYDLQQGVHPDTDNSKSGTSPRLLSEEQLRGLCYLYHWDFVCLNYSKPEACTSM
jgi:hypothetical protein